LNLSIAKILIIYDHSSPRIFYFLRVVWKNLNSDGDLATLRLSEEPRQGLPALSTQYLPHGGTKPPPAHVKVSMV
jgi:hypothetical protein